MTEADVQTLGEQAIQRSSAITRRGKILDSRPPMAWLFAWNELQPEGSNQVQAYLESKLEDDIFVAKLAGAFLSRERQKIDILQPLIDLRRFLSRLREIELSQSIEGDLEKSVCDFLDRWQETISGEKREKTLAEK